LTGKREYQRVENGKHLIINNFKDGITIAISY